MDFDSHFIGGVRVAVALVNTLTTGEEGGRPRPPLPEGDVRCQVVSKALSVDGSDARPDNAEAAAFLPLASKLRQVFVAAETGDIDSAATVVNKLLSQSGAAPRLDRHEMGPWHLHFHGRSAALDTSWAAGCATAMAVALEGEFANRLGVCRASSCDRVFFDESRNGSRRYCSLACQNRTKASIHRARKAPPRPSDGATTGS